MFKVLVVGDAGVGKTSLLRHSTDYVSGGSLRNAFGASLALQGLQAGEIFVNLLLLNVGDEPRFLRVRPRLYRGCGGVLYVFSVTDRLTFEHIPLWIAEVRKYSGHTPALLVGNKIDLTQDRTVTWKEGKTLAESLFMTYVKTSAVTGPYLLMAIQNLTVAILQPRFPKLALEQLIMPTRPLPSKLEPARLDQFHRDLKKPGINQKKRPLSPTTELKNKTEQEE